MFCRLKDDSSTLELLVVMILCLMNTTTITRKIKESVELKAKTDDALLSHTTYNLKPVLLNQIENNLTIKQ